MNVKSHYFIIFSFVHINFDVEDCRNGDWFLSHDEDFALFVAFNFLFISFSVFLVSDVFFVIENEGNNIIMNNLLYIYFLYLKKNWENEECDEIKLIYELHSEIITNRISIITVEWPRKLFAIENTWKIPVHWFTGPIIPILCCFTNKSK